jgi:Spy/CpxP family protein refolding chaperone
MRLERARQEKAKLAEILLPHQMKRLTEIYIQVAGVNALQDEDIAKELGITDAQTGAIASIRDANREAMRGLFGPPGGGPGGPGGEGDREAMMARFREAQAKMEEARKAGDAKILAVLTAEQKAKFEEMKGAKFELPEEALRAGFGGQGGFGRGPGGPGDGKRGPRGDNNPN